MVKIYEDNNWIVNRLIKLNDIDNATNEINNIGIITKDSIIFQIINKLETDYNRKKTYVLANISETPVYFKYGNLSRLKKLDISEVVEFVPLNILSKVFRYTKELEPKLILEKLKLFIYQNLDYLRGNYEIQNNIIEIYKVNSKLELELKFNERNFFIKIIDANEKPFGIHIKLKLLIPGYKDYTISMEIPKISFNSIIELIKYVIQSNLDTLEQYSPKKEYETFSIEKVGRGSASFTFGRLPDKSGKRTLQFIDYIKNKTSNGECATTKGFLESINKPTYSGYLSSFFSAIYNAGLVDREKNPSGSSKYCYVLGKNYQAWLKGKLKKTRG